jgi:hypothetical protein
MATSKRAATKGSARPSPTRSVSPPASQSHGDVARDDAGPAPHLEHPLARAQPEQIQKAPAQPALRRRPTALLERSDQPVGARVRVDAAKRVGVPLPNARADRRDRRGPGPHPRGGPAAHRSAQALLQKYGDPAATCTARERMTYVWQTGSFTSSWDGLAGTFDESRRRRSHGHTTTMMATATRRNGSARTAPTGRGGSRPRAGTPCPAP